MIKASEPINIFDLAKDEIKTSRAKTLQYQMIDKLKELRATGANNAKMVETIKMLNLPLGMHMYIMGHFTELFGRDI